MAAAANRVVWICLVLLLLIAPAVAVALARAAAPLLQGLVRSRRLGNDLGVANASLAGEGSHDALTGAPNRRHFEQQMQQLARSGATVGLMVLDLDHFEQINALHGHEAGDAALAEVARRLRGLLRGQDTVVRRDGGEFVLVLPGTAAEGMARLAGRVLRVIGGEPVRHRNRALSLTVSGGCAAHPLAPGRNWEDAFHLADAALFLARQSGGNRAICVTSVDPTAGAAPAEDLLAARRKGAVVLETVTGPAAAAARQSGLSPASDGIGAPTPPRRMRSVVGANSGPALAKACNGERIGGGIPGSTGSGDR